MNKLGKLYLLLLVTALLIGCAATSTRVVEDYNPLMTTQPGRQGFHMNKWWIDQHKERTATASLSILRLKSKINDSARTVVFMSFSIIKIIIANFTL